MSYLGLINLHTVTFRRLRFLAQIRKRCFKASLMHFDIQTT